MALEKYFPQSEGSDCLIKAMLKCITGEGTRVFPKAMGLHIHLPPLHCPDRNAIKKYSFILRPKAVMF